jgi:rod shape-determining protein MreD
LSARLRLVGLGLLLVLAQQLLASTLPEYVRPDLLLIFALALGLRERETEAVCIAFALGYTVDVLSGAPAGLYALLRGTACVATGLADRVLYLRAPGPWTAYVAGYVIVDALVCAAVLRLAQPDLVLPWTEVAVRLPGALVLTAAAAGPLFRVLQRLEPQDEGPGLLAAGSLPRHRLL